MRQNDHPSYVFAIPARPFNNDHRMIRDDEDERNLLTFLKGFTKDDVLAYAFEQRNTTNPFERSGYLPSKPVCLNVWITKFLSPTTM